MSNTLTHKIISFYQFVSIQEPEREVSIHKAFCGNHDIKARIYISEQGINAQLSAINEDAEVYLSWLKSHPVFSQATLKIDDYHEHVFPRLIIKYRELVAFDCNYDPVNTGEHVSPERWKEMLENTQERVLIDVRNDYEWNVGKFQGATTPQCNTFREFREYAEQLQKQINPETTPVMMYCTGGIRCEAYSAYLKEKGFKKVYQLEGGIINYGKRVGNKHWLGKLFVFDDRLTTPISNEETETIGICRHCGSPSESYYNCANMDCNELFLCCPQCLEIYLGCCLESCKTSPKLRPFQQQNPHKPFRKRYCYFDHCD